MASNGEMGKMPEKYWPGAKTLLELLLFAIGLGCFSLLSYCWMDGLLKEALIESVERQSRTIAFSLNQQFQQELDRLQVSGALLDGGQISARDLMEFYSVDNDGKHIGIVSPDGQPLVGEGLGEGGVAVLRDSAGKPAVNYCRDIGLIFTVPITLRGQDFYIYERYGDEELRKKFKALSFDGEGSLILIRSPEEWTVLSQGAELINTAPEMQPAWDKLWEEHQQHDPVAFFYRFRGNGYFVFAATVSDKYNFSITGYAPWQAVAVGIDYIYATMLAAFCSLLLLAFLGIRYIMKSRESEHFRQESYLADTANRAKSEFLSNMSHEIRTPINAVMGMGEMILRESREPQTLEYAENLQNAARNLLGLVNDILDFSKIEAGKMDIIPVEYAVSSLINDLVNMIKERADKKGLELKVEASRELPSILFGDEIRVRQVITNILTNAVKYTEKGSVTLSISHEPLGEDRVSLLVKVSDTGIGIKEEDMKKLFSPFERIEEKRNRTIEGTGLGMNITRQLLSLMGTELQVESTYGKGSVFSFRLEQKVMNPAPMGDFQEAYRQFVSQHQAYREKFTAPEARILVVDDTAMNLTVVKGLLKQTGLQIDTAESGAECLKLAAENRYDVIFLDHRMPGMDGIETLGELRKLPGGHGKDVPVISLTANAISGAREEYMAAGFQDYLTKPIDSNRLEELLLQYLPREKVRHSTASEPEEKADREDGNPLPSWLQEIRGLDIPAGVAHCGSQEAYLSALQVFAEAAAPGAEEIEGYFQREDWQDYTTKVHALKSSARIIGAQELSERAKRLEDAGNGGYVEELKADTGALLSLYRSYGQALSPLLQEEKGEEKPLIEPEALAEAYGTLREMAESFDYDSVKYLLDSLAEYSIPKEEAEKYAQIRQAALQPDWEKLQGLLGEESAKQQ